MAGMAVDLRLLFEKHGFGFLEIPLANFVGRPIDALKDEAFYRQRVISPGWQAAPLQFRMLSPDALGPRVALRPDWQARAQAALAGGLGPVLPGAARAGVRQGE